MATIATTGGATTLSANNSAADEARMAIIKVTGVLVSNATLTIPAVTKTYVVWNATTGAYTVTIKTSGGTGVVVAQGKKAFIFCDATDCFTAIDDTILSSPVLNEAKGSNVASAATTSDIWAVTGSTVHITGTTGITAFPTAPQAGIWRKLIFDDAVLLTDGANFVVPGGNYTTAADDLILVYADTTTKFYLFPLRANGTAIAGVSSVGWTGGIVSVANPTTTPAFTIAGTSGGIPYFSGATTWATSAALAANAIVLGGGAGAAPATTTTGTGVVTALGVNVGSAGAVITNGGALGTPSSGTLTSVTGLPIATGLSGLGGANRIPYASGATALVTSSTFTFDGTKLGIGIASPHVSEEIVAPANTAAVDGNDVTTWANLLISNPTNTAGAAAGIGFQVHTPYNAGSFTGIAAVAASAGDYDAHLIFLTRPSGSASAERMRITSAGVVSITSGQLGFPATQNASADANTLDDYEEGTWTPVLSFGGASVGIAYTTQTGTYVKIGKQVTVFFYILLSSNGSSTGSAVISGLPFATGITNLYVPLVGSNITSTGQLGCQVTGSTLAIINTSDAGTTTAVQESAVTDTAVFTTSLSYTI